MSLKKEVISKNGATALYHRIEGIKKDYNSLEVTVSSYVDEEYRNKEKELSELLQEREALIGELYVITAKGELSAEEKSRQEEIECKMNHIQELSVIHTYSVWKTQVTLEIPSSSEISFQEIYDRLKNESEIFRDAENC